MQLATHLVLAHPQKVRAPERGPVPAAEMGVNNKVFVGNILSVYAEVCYTEKAPHAWQRRGTPKKTRNTYNQPNWPNRQTFSPCNTPARPHTVLTIKNKRSYNLNDDRMMATLVAERRPDMCPPRPRLVWPTEPQIGSRFPTMFSRHLDLCTIVESASAVLQWMTSSHGCSLKRGSKSFVCSSAVPGVWSFLRVTRRKHKQPRLMSMVPMHVPLASL